MAKDLLNKAESMSEVKEAKAQIEKVIADKEKVRSGVLLTLDKISASFGSAEAKENEVRLEDQLAGLKEKLGSANGKSALQEINYEIGNIYTRISKFVDAKDAYNKVIRLDPDSAIAQKAKFNMAWNEKFQGNFEEAIKQFGNLTDVSDINKYQLAQSYRKNGEFDKAIAIFQEISDKSTDKNLTQSADINKGYTYLYDLKDIDKAKEVFDKAKESARSSSIATGEDSVAIPTVAGSYTKEGFKLLKQGYEFSSSEKYKQAMKSFDKALEIDPRDGYSYSGKALAYLWLKDPDRALGSARMAVKYLPDNEAASVNLGYIYTQLKMLDEAVVEYKRFIAVNPSSARGLYNLGCAFIYAGRLDEAAASFEKSINIDQTNYRAFNNQAWCLWQFGEYAKSIELFEKALKVKPDFLDSLYNLGVIYKSIGRLDESKVKFEAVLRIDPTFPKVNEYLKELEPAMQKYRLGTEGAI